MRHSLREGASIRVGRIIRRIPVGSIGRPDDARIGFVRVRGIGSAVRTFVKTSARRLCWILGARAMAGTAGGGLNQSSVVAAAGNVGRYRGTGRDDEPEEHA